jgi:hypothetical protein
MRFKNLLVLAAVLSMTIPALAQMNGARGTAEVTINGKKVTIDYGRPSLRGRDMLSEAKVGQVWRLGMNQATQIESTGSLVIAGKTLAAGKYTLWAKKTSDNSWTLAFHPKTGIWGQPEMTEGFVAELPLKLTKAPTSVEEFTITLADNKGNANIKIMWGTAVLTGSFKVQ